MREVRDQFARLTSGNFHYLDFGGAGRPPVALLHGTGFHARLWTTIGLALRRRFRVVALDLRGHGDSPKDLEDYRWGPMAEDLLEFLDATGLKRPLCVGHSMGGAVIVLAEELRAGAIGAGLLIDPILMGRDYYAGHWSAENDSMAARALRRRDTWASPQAMIDTYRNKPPFSTWPLEELRHYAFGGLEPAPDGGARLKCSPRIEAQVYLGGHASDPWPRLAEVRMPIRVLRGAASDTVGLSRVEAMLQILGHGELIEIPGATHYLPMERPDLIVTHVTDLAAAVTGPPAEEVVAPGDASPP